MDLLRVANCSGFYGDRLAAAKEMVEGGPIDVLTGDYLAELTMAILWRTQRKDPDRGYAETFVVQMGEVMATCLERGIRVVSNAGGLNPGGLATRLQDMATAAGLEPRIAVVDGDDLLDRLDDLGQTGELRHQVSGQPFQALGKQALTANAYLGGWGIASALDGGADIVVTGRVTDAALVIGPAAWRFGWKRQDWNPLAGALVAGHVIECGAHATGGNFSFFKEVPGLDHVGFPIAEIEPDGSFTVTKHPGTGGLVDVETVTAQILYEIGGPRYLNPDVVARFDTISLSQDGPDRVRVEGAIGEPPPPELKVGVNFLGGWRNTVTFALTGLDIVEKAAAIVRAMSAATGGPAAFDTFDTELVRWDRPDPPDQAAATAHLRITVKDDDQAKVGRSFSNSAVELALAHYPGLYLLSPPEAASQFPVFWPGLVSASLVPTRVTLAGESVIVPATEGQGADHARPGAAMPMHPDETEGPCSWAPLGAVAGARSGDKGGDANVGLWARTAEAWPWLAGFLTVERFVELVPESEGLDIDRYEFPNLRAINFVVRGLLGEGVAASNRVDPQAKALGEYLRARIVQVPTTLIEGSQVSRLES
jgi:hypothetical protein